MKVAYNAENSFDAHMILSQLKQVGIHGEVQGEYLQGAMGELPAFGLVKVLVPNDDYDTARKVIAECKEA